MYAVKYQCRYNGSAIYQNITEVYFYGSEDEAYHVFNKRVGMIKSLFSAITNNKYFFARVEIVKTNKTPFELANQYKYDFLEIYGSYIQKGILKIGYLGR